MIGSQALVIFEHRAFVLTVLLVLFVIFTFLKVGGGERKVCEDIFVALSFELCIPPSALYAIF